MNVIAIIRTMEHDVSDVKNRRRRLFGVML